jgi:hypothetical protein
MFSYDGNMYVNLAAEKTCSCLSHQLYHTPSCMYFSLGDLQKKQKKQTKREKTDRYDYLLQQKKERSLYSWLVW